MDDFSAFVPNVNYELIPIKNLVSNQDYQRALSRKHIERAAQDFDINQINPVKVSRRNGINYVFNGQHTIEIVALVSGSRDTPVWCMVYEDLSYEGEADIFANQQLYVKSLQPYEVYIANIEAGNDKCLMLRDIIQSYDLNVGTKKAPNVICAISTVIAIYDKYGCHILDRILRLIVATWQGDQNSFSANMMNALAKIVVTYGDSLNEDRFIDRLGMVPMNVLVRSGKAIKAGSVGLALAMIDEYNGKKHSNNKQLLNPTRLTTKDRGLPSPQIQDVSTYGRGKRNQVSTDDDQEYMDTMFDYLDEE